MTKLQWGSVALLSVLTLSASQAYAQTRSYDSATGRATTASPRTPIPEMTPTNPPPAGTYQPRHHTPGDVQNEDQTTSSGNGSVPPPGPAPDRPH